MDVEEPEPGGDPELDEERQEALDAAIEAEIQAEDRRKLLLQLVDVPPADEAGERAALLGVVERASGRLTELAAAHQARWDAEAIERAEQMSFDTGPEEERQWRYQFGCGRSLRQTLDTLLKLRRGGKGQGPSAGGHDDHSAAPPTAPESVTTEEERGPAPPAVAVEVIAPAAAEPPVQNEATAPAAAEPPVADEAATPAVPETSVQNEPSTSAVEHPGLQDEVIAPAGGAGRPVPAVPAIAPTTRARLFSASPGAAFGGPAEALGPEPSPPRPRVEWPVVRGGDERSARPCWPPASRHASRAAGHARHAPPAGSY